MWLQAPACAARSPAEPSPSPQPRRDRRLPARQPAVAEAAAGRVQCATAAAAVAVAVAASASASASSASTPVAELEEVAELDAAEGYMVQGASVLATPPAQVLLPLPLLLLPCAAPVVDPDGDAGSAAGGDVARRLGRSAGQD